MAVAFALCNGPERVEIALALQLLFIRVMKTTRPTSQSLKGSEPMKTNNHSYNPKQATRFATTLIAILIATVQAEAVVVTAEREDEGESTTIIQSEAMPLGLDIAGKVQAAGSDEAAAQFRKNVLPSVGQFVSTQLSEKQAVDDSSMLLDPSKLVLNTASDVRVYFVGEGAGYHNTLGFNTEGTGVQSGNPQLIFPDASSSVENFNIEKTAVRTASTPLAAGDFVNLGKFDAGTKLDFFLIANGAQGWSTTYSTDKSVNPDGINHVVAFTQMQRNSPYLIIGFEDMAGGGDRDFNDAVFVVDIGAANIAALTGTPEPTMWLTLGGCLGTAVWMNRRQRQGIPKIAGV